MEMIPICLNECYIYCAVFLVVFGTKGVRINGP